MGNGVKGSWQFWIDTGGTFTDCLARDPNGGWHRAKVLSSSQLRVTVLGWDRHGVDLAGVPSRADHLLEGLDLVDLGNPANRRFEITGYDGTEQYAALDPLPVAPGERDLTSGTWAVQSPEEAPLLGIRLILGLPLAAPLPPLKLRLATTKATNALLERKGAPVTLFVTRGFGDLLEIGTQQRPDLFARHIVKPRQLPEWIVEVSGRLASSGEQLENPDFSEDALPLPQVDGATAAISLINAYAHPEAERQLATKLAVRGWKSVIAGTELSGRIGYLQRTRTVAAEAFLDPMMRAYLDRVEGVTGRGSLLVMSSRGALMSRALLRSRDTLLSGPAGGLLGAAEIARRVGWPRTLTFDMGGTSTDVARFDERPDYRDTLRVGAAELQVTALRIETIAAGGGSICGFAQGALKVGPESAGSSPGPACYGAGGPLTITDVNVLLGRLDPAAFNLPLALEDAQAAADALLAEVGEGTLETMLEGLLEIANEKMAEALRRISVREGYDPREYALTAFGGAGGWHTCALADRLGMERVVFPADAGLLSAFGLSVARREQLEERQVLRPLDECGDDLAPLFLELEARARETLLREGLAAESLELAWARVSMRLRGQEATLEIGYAPGADMAGSFANAFRALFGFFPRGKAIEVVLTQVLVVERVAEAGPEEFPGSCAPPPPDSQVRAWIEGGWRMLPVFARERLEPGMALEGPAIIQDRFATIYLEADWRGRLGAAGTILLERAQAGQARTSATMPETVELELFTRRFTGIVEQMGALLRRTALSVNIRERLDFSCGLLDAEGALVANAPHIPVHLGALGLCVRSVASALGAELGPGSMAVTNHPGYGGSHLPDITVVAPVHTAGGQLLGYVANRAHHAELGGIRPGSMPPGARNLAEEGVVIPPLLVMRGGEVDLAGLADLLRDGPHPSRALEDNLADLQAQIAANRQGIEALRELAEREGAGRVGEYFGRLSSQAARAAERVFAELPGEERRAEQQLENGVWLRVRLRRVEPGGRMEIDFTGTSPVTPDSFNATPAIVRSALIYVLRLVSGEDIPLNEGFLRPVDLVLPECLLNPAFPAAASDCPAVVAGNVETSQRLVDTLLLALGDLAASQGTMNNTVFGNARFGYYETLGGGAGAGPEGPGASAVHTHMTNTAITDPEVLEARYPVRLRQFSIRPGSSGKGVHPGGDGLIREYEFLEPVEISLLTERRTTSPYGANGGNPGQPGWQSVIHADGTEETLPPSTAARLEAGERLKIATPGGGGWGECVPSGGGQLPMVCHEISEYDLRE